MNIYKLCLVCMVIASCAGLKNSESTPATAAPNILWITCEDISPTLSMYGDSTASTPHLDALALESVIYDNAFATVGVCAPARSSIITGMYPTSIGTMHMRTGKDIAGWGKRQYPKETGIKDLSGGEIPSYAAVVPSEVKCFTEYLRGAGYYCTNNAKTDYQFAAPQAAWDENSHKAHWRNTPEGQPFFSVFNINLTHESKLWKHSDKPLTVTLADVTVPPYLPDLASVRSTIARHYSNVELMDKQVGNIIQQLKEDGLYDDTIIFFYSDHGGPLPRQKREAYDSGLKVPLMIKHVNSDVTGREDKMVSFVDLAPTMLSLVGANIPNHLDGQSFVNSTVPSRTYIYGSGDRFDEHTDRVRIIRTGDYLYVKNYYPDMTGYKDIDYRKNIPGMVEILSAWQADTLPLVQSQWFEAKVSEELYNIHVDPHTIDNLAEDASYAAILKEHRTILRQHIEVYGDMGRLPESVIVEQMWPQGKQPRTLSPTVGKKNEQYVATCGTAGASISYLATSDPQQSEHMDAPWRLYTGPVSAEAALSLYFKAERIGYKESAIIKVKQ